jgi:hypothetical protein
MFRENLRARELDAVLIEEPSRLVGGGEAHPPRRYPQPTRDARARPLVLRQLLPCGGAFADDRIHLVGFSYMRFDGYHQPACLVAQQVVPARLSLSSRLQRLI